MNNNLRVKSIKTGLNLSVLIHIHWLEDVKKVKITTQTRTSSSTVRRFNTFSTSKISFDMFFLYYFHVFYRFQLLFSIILFNYCFKLFFFFTIYYFASRSGILSSLIDGNEFMSAVIDRTTSCSRGEFFAVIQPTLKFSQCPNQKFKKLGKLLVFGL